MEDIVEVKGLNAGYGKFHILFDINLSVRKGEIFVIVGPNGSGKSTLLKTIFGLTRVYSGSILFEGKDVTRKPPHVRAKMGMAYLPQRNKTYHFLYYSPA